jgi:vitamin B12 transporter
MRMYRICLLFALCLPFLTDAQNLIDSVVVTTTRIPSPVSNTGKSVQVIGQQELREMSVSSLDELLRYIPGLNVNSRGGFGVQADIGMRGSTFSQVLVLVDNVRFNDPLTAHFNSNFPLPLSEIDRIEVIRGPAGASYGADAVGGVIHIKTKTFTAQERKNSIQTVGSTSLGEHRLFMADGSFTAQEDKWLLSAGLRTAISDGEELNNPNFATGTTEDSLYNTDFDLRTYTASLAYFFNEYWKGYARAGFDTRVFNAKYFYTTSTFDESVEETDNLWFQGALQYARGRHSVDVFLGYKTVDDVFAFNPAFAPNIHTTQQTFGNVNHLVNISPKGSFAYGAQYVGKVIESTDRGDHQNNNLAFYGILSYELFSGLQATGSFRLEYDDNFGLEPLPQLSLAYKLDRVVLRSSIGRSIRSADFTERFVSSQIPNLTPGRNIGNPDLEAERSDSYELGADWSPWKGFSFSGTGFLRNASNLIDFTPTNSNDIDNVGNLQPNEVYLYATNVSESRTLGFEVFGEKRFEFNGRNSASLSMGYTYLETTNEGGEVSKYIANHPRHNLSVNATIQLGPWGFSTQNNFIERQPEAAELISGEVPEQYFISKCQTVVFSIFECL